MREFHAADTVTATGVPIRNRGSGMVVFAGFEAKTTGGVGTRVPARGNIDAGQKCDRPRRKAAGGKELVASLTSPQRQQGPTHALAGAAGW